MKLNLLASDVIVNAYVGVPYKWNARGPDEFDCWGIIIDIYKKYLGVELIDWRCATPDTSGTIRAIAEGREVIQDHFERVETPQDFDIALFVRNGFAYHAGVAMGGRILHSASHRGGVAWERVEDIRASVKGQVEFYRWRV